LFNSTHSKNIYKLLFVVICLGLTVAVLCEIIFSAFSDRSYAPNETGDAGTVIVELIEESPFNTTSDDSRFVDNKTFKGKSTGTLDTYIRAYLKPVVEAYDEIQGKWILIPVSRNDIVLEITEATVGSWVGTNAGNGVVPDLSDAKFFYYTKILKTDDETTDLKVQIVDINMPEQFLNMEIRYNLHVIIEGAQVKNSLWKKIFNIEALPLGVEVST